MSCVRTYYLPHQSPGVRMQLGSLWMQQVVMDSLQHRGPGSALREQTYPVTHLQAARSCAGPATACHTSAMQNPCPRHTCHCLQHLWGRKDGSTVPRGGPVSWCQEGSQTLHGGSQHISRSLQQAWVSILLTTGGRNSSGREIWV